MLNTKNCNSKVIERTKILELLVKDFSSNFSISEIIKQIGIIKSITFKCLKVLKT
jgi:hypothetical protein